MVNTQVKEEVVPEVPVEPPETPPDEASEAPEPEVKIEDRPEFQLAVAKATDENIQSAVDKRITPIYEERDSARGEVDRLKSALNIVETAELEAWGDDPPAREFQKERRRVTQLRQDAEKLAGDQRKWEDTLNERENGIRAWELAIKYALADPTVHSQVQAFVDDLVVFKDDAGMEKYAQARAKEFQTPESVNTPRRPDSSRPGAGGDSDESFMKKFASGQIPVTPETKKRHDKIVDAY